MTDNIDTNNIQFKRILAWDVGIKHLAYCIIETDISKKK